MLCQKLDKIKLPDNPGVYFFKKGSKILYIGRATSLKDRVRSYFANDLVQTRGRLIVDMVAKADNVGFEKTDSVLEAIILEASLIKKYQPYYNTKEKDDKSFNYVVITKEDFPQVLTLRGKDLKLKSYNLNLSTIFGPFPSGSALREALKFIRKIFPYRDIKCHLNSKRPCFNFHIGLCPGTCVGKISKEDYAKNIKNIINFFEGKKGRVLKDLEKEMRALAKEQKFEKAGEIKNKIFALKHIRDVAFIKSDSANLDSPYTSILQNTSIRNVESGEKVLRLSDRVEAYDIAHFGGKGTKGVMVVMEDGEFNKSEYKVFNIKDNKGGDDIGGLLEMLERRFKHTEWSKPTLVVIDGGETHLNKARGLINSIYKDIKVISVVKDDKHKARAILGAGVNELSVSNQDITKINAEAHRFAISRNRTRIRKNFLT
jgi:excinuclease ABC subunit C